MALKSFTALGLILTLLVSCEKKNEINDPDSLVPKTVVEDPGLPSIEANGAKLHAQAFGPQDSTLVICIHGGPGDNYQYLLNTISLANEGYRMVYYDQVGAGLSERKPKSYYTSFGANGINNIFYDELKAVIAHYKTHPDQKVILLTQSWGSILATGYAGKYPAEIDGLILAEPGGFKWDDVITYVKASRSFNLWSELLNDATFFDQFITGKENEHAILDYKALLLSSRNDIVGDFGSIIGTNKQYYPNVRDGAVISAAAYEIADKYKPDFSEGIENFNKKILFLYSEKNKAYPDSWAQKIASPLPNKQIVKINGVGHSGMFDQLNTWNNITQPLLINYLNSIR